MASVQPLATSSGGTILGTTLDDDLIDYSDHEEDYISPVKSRHDTPATPKADLVVGDIAATSAAESIVAVVTSDNQSAYSSKVESSGAASDTASLDHGAADGDVDGFDIDFGFPQNPAQHDGEVDGGDDGIDVGSPHAHDESGDLADRADDNGLANDEEAYKIDYDDHNHDDDDDDDETVDNARKVGAQDDVDGGLGAGDSDPLPLARAEDEITYDDDDQEENAIQVADGDELAQDHDSDPAHDDDDDDIGADGYGSEDEDEAHDKADTEIGHDMTGFQESQAPIPADNGHDGEGDNQPRHDYQENDEEEAGGEDDGEPQHSLDEDLDTIMRSAQADFQDHDSFDDESMDDAAWPVVTVSYKGDEYPMFAAPDKMGFFSDVVYLDRSMAGLLAAFRAELSAELRSDEELVFQLDELGLEYCESTDSQFLEAITLRQAIDIHARLVKNQSADSSRGIYTFLFTKPNPASRLAFIMENADAGKGLDAVARYFQAPLVQSAADDIHSAYPSQGSLEGLAGEGNEHEAEHDHGHAHQHTPQHTQHTHEAASASSDGDYGDRNDANGDVGEGQEDAGVHNPASVDGEEEEGEEQEEEQEEEEEEEEQDEEEQDEEEQDEEEHEDEQKDNADAEADAEAEAGAEIGTEAQAKADLGHDIESFARVSAGYAEPALDWSSLDVGNVAGQESWPLDHTLAAGDFDENDETRSRNTEQSRTADEEPLDPEEDQDSSLINETSSAPEEEAAINAAPLGHDEQIPIDLSADNPDNQDSDNQETQDSDINQQTSASSTVDGDDTIPAFQHGMLKNQSTFVYDENEIDWREEGDDEAGDDGPDTVSQEPHAASPSRTKRSRVEAELLDLEDGQNFKRRRS